MSCDTAQTAGGIRLAGNGSISDCRAAVVQRQPAVRECDFPLHVIRVECGLPCDPQDRG